MSTFACPVVEIRAIEPIPGADAIELAVVGDYRSVIRKGQFEAGASAIYIPEGSVLPAGLIEEMGLTGRLAGSAKNRVKAIKLRGCLSQGLLYPGVGAPGEDHAEELGIIKYEPTIPSSMSGSVAYVPPHNVANIGSGPLRYDIENVKAYSHVLEEGEPVVFTEKTHGTFCGVAVIPGLDHPEMFDGDGIIYSKGLGGKGLCFKNSFDNKDNLYVRTVREFDLHKRIRQRFPGKTVHVLGEIYGTGVQDLTYGQTKAQFAAFDIHVDGHYVDADRFERICAFMSLPRVPTLYAGRFSRQAMQEHTNGPTQIGRQAHIREGIVIRPMKEREHHRLGRVILKSVSEAYLLRKGETTEFS